MNSKTKRNRTIVFAGSIILLLVVTMIIYFMFFKTKSVINFNEKYLSLEYGETLDYTKAIESTNPEKVKIEYPKVEVKELGNYRLIFNYTIDGKKGSQEQKFVVKDTKLPNAIIKNEKVVEVVINSEYDPFANIQKYKNFSEEAQQNRQQVSDEDYKKLKKKVEKQNKYINDREITKQSDIKQSDVLNSCIIFTTDFDVTNEGTYKIKMLFVDENYNTDEESWSIKVVPAGQLVNSGGKVTCVYPNDNIQSNEAYTTDYTEVYTYDDNKTISVINFITSMTFKDDYDTDENINALVSAINQKYADYIEKPGVTINVNPSAKAVITSIVIDFNTYDIKSDPLNVLESKEAGKVKISNVIDKLKDKATCELT